MGRPARHHGHARGFDGHLDVFDRRRAGVVQIVQIGQRARSASARHWARAPVGLFTRAAWSRQGRAIPACPPRCCGPPRRATGRGWRCVSARHRRARRAFAGERSASVRSGQACSLEAGSCARAGPHRRGRSHRPVVLLQLLQAVQLFQTQAPPPTVRPRRQARKPSHRQRSPSRLTNRWPGFSSGLQARARPPGRPDPTWDMRRARTSAAR